MLREGFFEGSLMRKTSSPSSERKCDACNGTGLAESQSLDAKYIRRHAPQNAAAEVE
jgi:hypothetical protein